MSARVRLKVRTNGGTETGQFRLYQGKDWPEIVPLTRNGAAIFSGIAPKTSLARACGFDDGHGPCRRITLQTRCPLHREAE